MTPDQYRREGADVMRAACVHAVNATASPIVGTPYSAGGRAFSDAIRAIDVDDVLARLPPAPDAVARLVEAAKWVRDQSCEGFCRDLPRDDYYDKEMDIDCAGCRVRATLAAMEASHD